jgi:hypothetical protein
MATFSRKGKKGRRFTFYRTDRGKGLVLQTEFLKRVDAVETAAWLCKPATIVKLSFGLCG